MTVMGRGRLVQVHRVTVLLASLLVLPSAETEAADFPHGANFVPNELLASFTAEAARNFTPSLFESGRVGDSEFDKVAAEVGVKEVVAVFREQVRGSRPSSDSQLGRVVKLIFDSERDIFSALDKMSGLSALEYVELNLVYRATLLPSDSEWEEQWALHNQGRGRAKFDADIDAPEAWEIEQGRSGVLIAIVDTGINHRHPDLRKGRVLRDLGYDFINNRVKATDDHGHGTYVAGIAGASSNNGRGVAGVCWNCGLIPVKVLNEDGEGTADQVASGIRFAAERGAQIINMSLGFSSGCGCSNTVAVAINFAWESGALLVGASGNDGDREAISYPGASSRVLAVGASDKEDEQSSFSNLDRTVDLLAPGEDIIGLDARKRKGTYREASGTSAAAPHVSGVAGLIWSANPKMTNAEVWRTLRGNGDRLTRSLPRRLNAFKALEKPRGRGVRARVDNCAVEPECFPGCGAEITLSPEVRFGEWVILLRALRDNLLATSPIGEELARMYREHRLEILAQLLESRQLREETRNTISSWKPVLVYALMGSGGGSVSWSQAEAVKRSIESFEVRASPRLRRDLALARGHLAALGVLDAGTLWSDVITRLRYPDVSEMQ